MAVVPNRDWQLLFAVILAKECLVYHAGGCQIQFSAGSDSHGSHSDGVGGMVRSDQRSEVKEDWR
jgi:hypothetical protein